MIRVIKIIVTLLFVVSFATANRDPLDVLRERIPRKSVVKVKKKKRRTYKKKRSVRVHKKRKIRKKRRIVRKVKVKVKSKSKNKKKKVAVKKKSRKRRFISSNKEFLGPTKNHKHLSKPIQYDIYSKHKLTGVPYLDMKAIDGPMPEDYTALYLKSKSLKNPVKPSLKIVIDKSSQRMYVYRDFEHLYTFKVSTGKRGFRTPNGIFKPYSVERMHYSRQYYNAPMPWSVFFNGGVAIHATSSIGRLGRPASHGCVRTYPKSAKRVY